MVLVTSKWRHMAGLKSSSEIMSF